MPILKALSPVAPNRVLAEGSAALWVMQIQGKNADGSPFTDSSMCNYSGGMAARRPMVMIEARMPIGPA
jgi:N-methylhydantoinase B